MRSDFSKKGHVGFDGGPGKVSIVPNPHGWIETRRDYQVYGFGMYSYGSDGGCGCLDDSFRGSRHVVVLVVGDGSVKGIDE